MTTVFQFGNAQFVKDVIFGWHFRPSDDHDWIKLADFPTDVLKELSTATFPAYVPDDLKKTILNELEARQLHGRRALELGTVVMTAWKKYDERVSTAEATANRLGDQVKLMASIIENMRPDGDSVTADLEYVKISRGVGRWLIRGTRDEEPERLITIGDAVQRIMKRWW